MAELKVNIGIDKIDIIKTELNPNDIIILQARDDATIEDLHNSYVKICEAFPNYQVIGLAPMMSMEIMDWNKLHDFVMSIKPKKEK